VVVVNYLVVPMPADFIKHPDEKVIWEGKPEYKPFLMKGFSDFFRSILWLTFVWGIFIIINGKNGLNWTVMYLVAFITIGDGLFRLGRKILSYSKTVYYITNRMIYIQNGVIMPKLTAFERGKISFVDIEASKIEMKFNAGTVLIHFGEIKLTDGKEEKVYQKFESIKNPGNIVKLLP